MGVYTRNNIVTNGLILYVDAANPQSYTSGSVTWKDLSGNGYNGTLTNGPTYSSVNNGSVVFDGVDRTTTTSSHINPASSAVSFTLGQYGTSNPFNMSGSFGMFAAYNKQLSPAEVFQNYTATKARYGL